MEVIEFEWDLSYTYVKDPFLGIVVLSVVLLWYMCVCVYHSQSAQEHLKRRVKYDVLIKIVSRRVSKTVAPN